MTAHGLDFHQLFIDQVQLIAIEPEPAAIQASHSECNSSGG